MGLRLYHCSSNIAIFIMWSYHISVKNAAQRLVAVSLTVDANPSGTTEFCLPRWRPGRYELGNFAKNLTGFSAKDESGKLLSFHKSGVHTWLVNSGESTKVTVAYTYYAAQPDAGACWTDERMLYVNPVHCCMYVPGLLHTTCEVQLEVPNHWQIATSMKVKGPQHFLAADFHELVDSPFFASSDLQHDQYEVNGKLFHIWFQGDCAPDWTRLKKDFREFTQLQLDMMGSFPVNDYHFLILVLPFRFYHGVEHVGSTVLALGPGYKLMEKELYDDLLGVASHELFHVWNVKTLRPADFNEYDYSCENYSKLGWVYEGFTTYYGDLFLARSGYFSAPGFFNELNARLQKHSDNAGKWNLGVADSSFETWLDGYVPGVPNRKTSIYDEGAMIALLLDLQIRKQSKGKLSLDDLFRRLYTDFSLPRGTGYRETDLCMLAHEMGGDAAVDIIQQLAGKATDYTARLQEMLSEVGCYIARTPSKNLQEKHFGLRTVQDGGVTKVVAIWPGSPADKAGLAKDDELVSCNDWKIENNLSDLLAATPAKEAILGVFSQRKWKTVQLTQSDTSYYATLRIEAIQDATAEQRAAFTQWCGCKFPY